MGGYLSVRGPDKSNKDLLYIGHLVYVERHETFHDILDRVLCDAAYATLLTVNKLQPHAFAHNRGTER
jgi:hypothetical protein